MNLLFLTVTENHSPYRDSIVDSSKHATNTTWKITISYCHREPFPLSRLYRRQQQTCNQHYMEDYRFLLSPRTIPLIETLSSTAANMQPTLHGRLLFLTVTENHSPYRDSIVDSSKHATNTTWKITVSYCHREPFPLSRLYRRQQQTCNQHYMEDYRFLLSPRTIPLIETLSSTAANMQPTLHGRLPFLTVTEKNSPYRDSIVDSSIHATNTTWKITVSYCHQEPFPFSRLYRRQQQTCNQHYMEDYRFLLSPRTIPLIETLSSTAANMQPTLHGRLLFLTVTENHSPSRDSIVDSSKHATNTTWKITVSYCHREPFPFSRLYRRQQQTCNQHYMEDYCFLLSPRTIPLIVTIFDSSKHATNATWKIIVSYCHREPFLNLNW